MKIPKLPHKWNVSIKDAARIQRSLAPLVKTQGRPIKIRWIAGVDSAFSPDGKRCIAGVVLWDRKLKTATETQTAVSPVFFPYIPGFLSFREAPAIFNALKKLTRTPDLIICDGYGVAHPRRFGIACHIGLLTRIPAIGCAKSPLIGEFKTPAAKRGSTACIIHKGEKIGTVLRTQDGIKPVFVSIGDKINLIHAEKIVLESAIRFRLPEPTRLADRLVAKVKKGKVINRDG